jgi:hypothetical protein
MLATHAKRKAFDAASFYKQTEQPAISVEDILHAFTDHTTKVGPVIPNLYCHTNGYLTE